MRANVMIAIGCVQKGPKYRAYFEIPDFSNSDIFEAH